MPDACETATDHKRQHRAAGPNSTKKLFVLDTNVLIHDPSCLEQFEGNDIFILYTILEELDGLKKGTDETARCAREALRRLSAIVERPDVDGVNLSEDGVLIAVNGRGTLGRLFIGSVVQDSHATKADNRILAEVLDLQQRYEGSRYAKVILVSKDTNIRLKAKAQRIIAEDYRTDIAIKDTDFLPTGMVQLPQECWDSAQQKGEPRVGETLLVHIPLPSNGLDEPILQNQLMHDGNGHDFIVRQVHEHEIVAARCRNFQRKHSVFGIRAINREQNFAVNLLLDPEIDCVTLLGPAGTGKTLVTIAAALAQLDHPLCDPHREQEQPLYDGIIMTRITVPIGPEIGYLPGSEDEKMNPWMGALSGNLEVIAEHIGSTRAKEEGGRRTRARNGDKPEGNENCPDTRPSFARMLSNLVQVKSINFFRGITFNRKFVIVDEAQNLNARQIKTLITRVGPGTKMVIMGNLGQIDTPWLSANTSGLSHLAVRFLGEHICGHVILRDKVRSRLAKLGEEKL